MSSPRRATFAILSVMPFVLAALTLLGASSPRRKNIGEGSADAPGNETCVRCHAEIGSSYQKTAMATASGLAKGGLLTGEFEHKESKVRYRVFERNGKAWLSYERGGKDGIHGERELLYYIGSGRKGRTYLFSDDGFLFETPINWYAQEKRWNMAPAFTEAREIPMNLPAFVDCLNCHTSGVSGPVKGTENKYPGEAFLHAGITCERCHGAGEGHAESKANIVNPVKLPAERRDSICMECHFEGAVAVEQAGKHLYQFQPGEKLSDYEHYFVMASDPEQQTPRALSQFEALSLSGCKRSAGEKMWCGSCHDAHREPAAEEKSAYYRGKCLACHGEAFGAKHHADKPDCRPCHMPALPSKDVAHTESTDHRILRYPTSAALPQLLVRGKPLVAFPASNDPLTTTRDYALAWQTLSRRGIPDSKKRAEQYLRKAVIENPDDAVVLSALGFVEQQHGANAEAKALYERALKSDPLAIDAATNLGIIEARSGEAQRAVDLWQRAFVRAPYRSAIGMDLAIVFCSAGQKEEARKYVERVLEFNPDYEKGKSLQAGLNQDPADCKP